MIPEVVVQYEIPKESSQSFLEKYVVPSGKLFSDRAEADLYWESLIQMAHNNRDEALATVDKIRLGYNGILSQESKKIPPRDIEAFFDYYFISNVEYSPETLTYMGLFDSIGIKDHNAYLDDASPYTNFRRLALAKENLKALETYSLEGLTAQQQISHKVLMWDLQIAVDEEPFLFHQYVISQTFVGILPSITSLFTQFHRLNVQEDVENYIIRLAQIPQKFNQVIETLHYQVEKGIFTPRFALEKAVHIIDAFISVDVKDNPLYLHLAEVMSNMELTNENVLLAKAESVIRDKVYPVYIALQDYCKEQLDSVKTDHGVGTLPDGEAFYAYSLKYHTTTDISADDIHALGLKEIKHIQDEMRAIFAEEGIVDLDKEVGELMQELSKDSRFYYPNTSEGRAQCLADFAAILERSREKLWPLFGIKPTDPVKILPIPEIEEDGMPGAFYYRPSLDGTRPGIFFVNLRDMREVPKYKMETLAIHEAEPGHHFQLSIQNFSDLPVFRKLETYPGYAEGWALYTEKLAYEEGFYATSYDKLGHLQDELMRAVRLVVDTGIHHRGWSREEAIAYMEKVLGSNHESIVTEIERYFVYPGQACSYKIGQLKILELRQRAKDMLGDKFDIRGFHDAVLQCGCVPLAVLEEIVDNYILQTKG